MLGGNSDDRECVLALQCGVTLGFVLLAEKQRFDLSLRLFQST